MTLLYKNKNHIKTNIIISEIENKFKERTIKGTTLGIQTFTVQEKVEIRPYFTCPSQNTSNAVLPDFGIKPWLDASNCWSSLQVFIFSLIKFDYLISQKKLYSR